jgi:hypothetical protein
VRCRFVPFRIASTWLLEFTSFTPELLHASAAARTAPHCKLTPAVLALLRRRFRPLREVSQPLPPLNCYNGESDVPFDRHRSLTAQHCECKAREWGVTCGVTDARRRCMQLYSLHSLQQSRYIAIICCWEFLSSAFAAMVFSGAATLQEQYAGAGSVMDVAGGYMYVAVGVAPGKMHKVALASFTDGASVSLGSDARFPNCGVIDAARGYAYLGMSDSPAVVVKVSLSTFSRVDAIVFNSGEDYLSAAVIDSANGYAYFATDTIPSRVVRISLAPFSRVDSILLLSDEGGVGAAVIDIVNGFAYFGGGSVRGKVIQVSLNPFARRDGIYLASNEVGIRSAVIAESAGFAFFGTQTTPGIVVQVALGNLARVAAVVLASGEDNLLSAVIDASSGFAYFGTWTAPSSVVQVSLNPLSRVDALPLSGGRQRGALMDTIAGYAYFITDTYPTAINRIFIRATPTASTTPSATPTSTETATSAPSASAPAATTSTSCTPSPSSSASVELDGAAGSGTSGLAQQLKNLIGALAGGGAAAICAVGGFLYRRYDVERTHKCNQSYVGKALANLLRQEFLLGDVDFSRAQGLEFVNAVEALQARLLRDGVITRQDVSADDLAKLAKRIASCASQVRNWPKPILFRPSKYLRGVCKALEDKDNASTIARSVSQVCLQHNPILGSPAAASRNPGTGR